MSSLAVVITTCAVARMRIPPSSLIMCTRSELIPMKCNRLSISDLEGGALVVGECKRAADDGSSE